MKKAMVNFWVDAVIGVAFLACAVTGILFLLPSGVRSVSADGVTMFGVGMGAWRFLHDWSGVVMTAGILLHALLHYRWIVNMSRRAFGATPAKAPATRAPRPASPQPRLQPQTQPMTVYRAGDEKQLSRKTFLSGAALAGGALLVTGIGLAALDQKAGAVRRALASSQSETATQNGGTAQTTTGGEDQYGWSGGGSSSGSAAGGSSSGSAQSAGSGGTATTAARVVVASGACVACGRCLSVCPAGVFGWSGNGTATASNAGACTGCRRCLSVCPASAITVNV